MTRTLLLSVLLVFASAPVLAQSSTTVQGSGTPNTIPQFSSSTTLASSAIFQDPNTGYVGINTTATDATLTVGPTPGDRNAILHLNAGGGAEIMFTGGCCGYHNFQFGHWGWGISLLDTTTQTQIFGTYPDGRALFGPPVSWLGPNDRISSIGGIVVDQNDDNADDMYYNIRAGNTPISPDFSLGLQFGTSSGEGIASPRGDGAPNLNGLDFYTGFNKRMSINQAGNVGIGTQTPQSALEVHGNIAITSQSGGSIIFQDGTVQSTAYTGTCTATGGDYAESIDVDGPKADYEPGDILVIDPQNPGHFLRSTSAYSTLVAGIYSTKPGYVGRRQQTNPSLASAEVPMAMVGIVPTKVTSENGPIHTGDLLVTASKAGYAMKGTDHDRMTGAILGKALGDLKTHEGVIEVLVSLQ